MTWSCSILGSGFSAEAAPMSGKGRWGNGTAMASPECLPPGMLNAAYEGAKVGGGHGAHVLAPLISTI